MSASFSSFTSPTRKEEEKQEKKVRSTAGEILPQSCVDEREQHQPLRWTSLSRPLNEGRKLLPSAAQVAASVPMPKRHGPMGRPTVLWAARDSAALSRHGFGLMCLLKRLASSTAGVTPGFENSVCEPRPNENFSQRQLPSWCCVSTK